MIMKLKKIIIIRPRNLLSKALSHLSPKAINKSLCQKASFLPYYFVVSAVQFRSERGQKKKYTNRNRKEAKTATSRKNRGNARCSVMPRCLHNPGPHVLAFLPDRRPCDGSQYRPSCYRRGGNKNTPRGS